MAEAVVGAESFFERNHFVIRRLHSLTGIVPIGGFLCFHLIVNATILLKGGAAFQHMVNVIHLLAALGIIKAVEVMFIFLPILFHAVIGVAIWLTGRSNMMAYRHGDNIRYTLQRWTGIVALVFIVLHLWHMHWINPYGGAFDPHDAPASAIKAMAALWTGPVYLVGLLASVFHFANGVWTFLITWGITISPKSQQMSGRICVALGVVLTLLGCGALVGLKNAEVASFGSLSTTHQTAEH